MKKGFTLVELVVVMVLLAIVSAVVLVGYQNIMNSSRDSEVKGAVAMLRAAIDQYSATEIAAGRATRGASGTDGGWPTLSQLNEVKYGGTGVVITDVPENAWAKVVFSQDFDNVIQSSGVRGGGAVSWNDDEEGIAYASQGPPPGLPVVICELDDHTAAGWCYNETTGDLWARTSRSGENNF